VSLGALQRLLVQAAIDFVRSMRIKE
jgi:hypothetical protein